MSYCSRSEVLSSQHTVSMVAEMIHIASLAHDDVIDGATVRRGKPSVNAKWGEKMVSLILCLFGLACMQCTGVVGGSYEDACTVYGTYISRC